MSTGAEHSFIDAIAEAVAHQLRPEIERLRLAIETGIDSSTKGKYVEPGPGSERQYFSPPEIAERMGWGLTKVYELTEDQLPRLKHGQLVRYHWAYVWALEGKISRETADELFRAHDAIQARRDIPHRNSKAAGLRRVP